MRFHLPALPGQPTVASNSSCAYTNKVRRFAGMMGSRGHQVFVYGQPLVANPWPGIESVEYIDLKPYEEPVEFSPQAWADANHAVLMSIGDYAQPGDYLLPIAGRCQEKLAALLDDLIPVEFGIGYGGSFADFRVFESYAWMVATYAAQGNGDAHALDGNAYHAVIPNYFDVEEFPIGRGEGDNLLYVGRLIERKGVEVAVNVARATGLGLFLAGEGDYRPGAEESNIEYIGSVGPRERAELMGDARCLLAPTQYIEPFGGVVVEAALCGTPAITTDWGAFPETVMQGITGYRCRRLGEFIWAAENAGHLDRTTISTRARLLYSTETIAERYDNYFRHLDTLRSGGWYDPTPAPPGLALPG